MQRGRRIDYEDDLVIVYDKSNKVIYKGMEDYEPYKDEPWKWDEQIGGYRFDGMVKICVA